MRCWQRRSRRAEAVDGQDRTEVRRADHASGPYWRRAAASMTQTSSGRGHERTSASTPRIALTRSEASRALGISLDSFERYVQPEVRVIRRGRMRLIPLKDLERWADENAALTLDRRVR